VSKKKHVAVGARTAVLTVLFTLLPYAIGYTGYPYVRVAPTNLLFKALLVFFIPSLIVGLCLGYYGWTKVKQEKRLALLFTVFSLILYIAIFSRFSIAIT